MCELTNNTAQLATSPQFPQSQPLVSSSQTPRQGHELQVGITDRLQARAFRKLQRLYQHPAVNSSQFSHLSASERRALMPTREVHAKGNSEKTLTRSCMDGLIEKYLGTDFKDKSPTMKETAVERHIEQTRAVASKPSLSDQYFIQSLSRGYSPSQLSDKQVLSQVNTKQNTASHSLSANAVHKLLRDFRQQKDRVAKFERQSKQILEKRLAQSTRKRTRTEFVGSENHDGSNEVIRNEDEVHANGETAAQMSPRGMRITRASVQKTSKSAGGMPASKCCFCPDPLLFGGEELSSELLGPFVDRKGRAKLFVHFNCANWAPQVFTDSQTGQLRGVYDEYCRARQLKCSDCGGRGATIGCYVKRCKRVFHFRCLASSNAKKVERHFAAFCANHSHLAETSLYQTIMDAATIADVAAAHRREDSTAGLDAPHSRYTQVRRRETEVIFSRKLGVCSHTGAFEAAKVIFSHKRRRIIKKSDRLKVADRIRCLLASAFDVASGRLAYMGVAGTDEDLDAMTPVEARAALASREHTRLLLLRNLRKAPTWTRTQIQVVKNISGTMREKEALQSNTERSKLGGRDGENRAATATISAVAEGSKADENLEPKVTDNPTKITPESGDESSRRVKRRRVNSEPESGVQFFAAAGNMSKSSEDVTALEKGPSTGASEQAQQEEVEAKSGRKEMNEIARPKGSNDQNHAQVDGTISSGRQGLAGKVKSAWEIFLEEQLPRERLLRPDDPEVDAMRNMARLWSLLSVQEREDYQEKARRSGLASGDNTGQRSSVNSAVPNIPDPKGRAKADRNADAARARSNGQVAQRQMSQRRNAGLFARSNRAEGDQEEAGSKSDGGRKGVKSQPSVSLPRRIRIEHRKGNTTRYDDLVAVDWDELLPSALQSPDEAPKPFSRVRPLSSREKRKS